MKDECKRWISFAAEDLQIAELALKERIYNQVCFHSQQCVEKILKAYLLAEDKIYPKTHKLAELMASLESDSLEDLATQIIALDRFYIPTRYPDTLPGALPEGMPSEKDAVEALNIARKLFEKADKEIGTT